MKIYMHDRMTHAYVSRGNLMDNCRYAGIRYPQDSIKEYELKCSPEEESDLLSRIEACRDADEGRWIGEYKPELFIQIYSDHRADALFGAPPKGTTFSLTDTGGEAVPLNLLTYPGMPEDAILNNSMIFKNDRGYYIREIVNPNYDGHGDGKLLFPDRSYHGQILDMVPVDVKVTADKGNYGFFIPQFPDLSYDNLPAILDYLWERDIDTSTMIKKIESPILGTFYVWNDPAVRSYSGTDRIFIEGEDGKAVSQFRSFLDYARTGEHLASCCVWEKSFGELLLEDMYLDVWALEEGSVLEAIEKQFHHCKFLHERRDSGTTSLDIFRKYYPNESHRILGAYWKKDMDKRFGIRFLDEAIVDGAIVPYECIPEGTVAFGFEPENFTAFIYTGRDEFFKLISYVSEVNENAEENIQSKIDAGKIKLAKI